jgi:hypothetical protein
MTRPPDAIRGTRNLFLLAYAAVTVGALALVAGALVWSHARPQQATPTEQAGHAVGHAVIPSDAWGHATYRTRGMSVTLGPSADRRHRYELSFDRSDLAPAGLEVSNDRGRTFFVLEGEPMGKCGYHWQGYGVNAILAVRECVPIWAVDDAGQQPKFWLRVENLVSFARVVFFNYG